MCEFKDFRRNIPCFEEYDENSFIGKWYDDGVWDDEEYWKLENDLIEVRRKKISLSDGYTKGYRDWNRYHY